ncbi:MAG TPA: Gfo/Idh/MocA family oxidoreductase [Bryobacteraceae bacterium]|jgi:predicted dehydrogenase
MSEATPRRDFTKGAASGLLILAPQIVRGYQANSALSVGLIGCGRRGTAITQFFAQNEFAKVAALCDIYDDQIAQAAQKFSGARHFKNMDDVLASDVDAVYIATPPYLHPPHFEAAVKSRKHIFMEKPAGVDPAGVKRVVEAAKKADKSKRITIDFQQRYGKDYKKAYEIVNSGELGKIVEVRASWLSGGLPLREGHPADQEQMRNWLFYREKSGDFIVEQDCHNLDVVNWFTGMHPTKVAGYGGRMVRMSPGNIMDNLALTYHFDNGLVFSYSANQICKGGFTDVSETFICENGAINTSRKGYKVYNGGKEPVVVTTSYDITKDAVDDFVDGARNGRLENAAFHAAISTLTGIMGREAIYAGTEKTWDKSWDVAQV